MRILISAANFNEDWRMASQRPRALAEMLARRGHGVTVLTMATEPSVTANPPADVEVITTAPYEDMIGAPVQVIPRGVRLAAALSVLTSTPEIAVLKRPRLLRALGWSESARDERLVELNNRRRRTVAGVKRVAEDWAWYRESASTVDRLSASREPYDIVFATYSTYGSLWLGYLARKVGLARRLIVDFRDLMDQPGPLLPLHLFNQLQQQHALRKADAVTVVSKGLRKNILEDRHAQKYGDKIHVLYNGFIRGADASIPKDRGSKGALRIVYTGSLYQGQRDATALFSAIRQALRDDPSLRFEVHYAGGAGPLMRAMAQTQGVESCVVDHGFLPREDAVRLQATADILLALSWNTSGNEGVLTGKFPEYLAHGKPILSIVSGDISGAELTELVNDMRLGIGVEQPAQPEDEERLVDFLRRASQSAANGKHLCWDASPREVDRFNYERIAARLEHLAAHLSQ